MLDALGDFLEQGRLKLYCSESNVAEAWTRRESDPAWRIQRHQAFEAYVVHELAAFIREDCQSPDIPIAVSGTSLGAFYAMNFALKEPELFRYALCMSCATASCRASFSHRDNSRSAPRRSAGSVSRNRRRRRMRRCPPTELISLPQMLGIESWDFPSVLFFGGKTEPQGTRQPSCRLI